MTFYLDYVCKHLPSAFPKLTSYNRFIELMPSALVPLCCYLHTRRGEYSGISFIDSTTIAVCHNRRIPSHKVFADLAQRGKKSVDWFFGFKLHLVINDCGELLAVRLTPGNTDDRTPVPHLARELFGKLFGDKGYISQKLFDSLFAEDVQLVTKLKTNMKNKLMPMFDKIMTRKRAIIESDEWATQPLLVPLSYLIGDAAAARTSPSEIAVSFLSAADSSSSVSCSNCATSR